MKQIKNIKRAAIRIKNMLNTLEQNTEYAELHWSRTKLRNMREEKAVLTKVLKHVNTVIPVIPILSATQLDDISYELQRYWL